MSNAQHVRDPGAMIRSAKLPEKEFRVCVEPDLVAEYERLSAQRDKAKEEAKKAGAGSLAGANTAELDAQIADVQEQMAAATVVLRLRALGRRPWKALRDEHPPRKGEDGSVLFADMRLGVNAETFMDPLVRASIVAPEMDDETTDLLLDERLTDGQWSELTTLCWNLNEERISVPFSPAASQSRTSSSPK